MTQIDISRSVDDQLPWKLVANKTNGYISGDGRVIKCKTDKHLSFKDGRNSSREILQVLHNSSVASDFLKSLELENGYSVPQEDGRGGTPEADNFDEVLSKVAEAQCPVNKFAEDEKAFQEIRSYGNANALKSLRVVSEKGYPCTCVVKSDDPRSCLYGWRKETDDIIQDPAKNSKKVKSYTNVFQRLVSESKVKGLSFKHYAETGKYMDEYRRQHTVGNVCSYNLIDPPKIGIDFIDPYAVKIKNIWLNHRRSVADTFDLSALVPVDKERSCLDVKDMTPHSAKSTTSVRKLNAPETDDKRTERGSAETRPSRTVPTLAPVRRCKSPNETVFRDAKDQLLIAKETMLRDANDQLLTMDRYLELQYARSKTLPKIKCKTTIISPDPVSGSTVTPGLRIEHTSKFQSFREHSSKIKYSDTSLVEHSTTENKIALTISRFRAIKNQHKTALKISDFFSTSVFEDGVHQQTKSSGSQVSEQNTTGLVNKLKSSRLKDSMKRTKTARRQCARLISVTLGDIGINSESDAESMKRGDSPVHRVKKQSRSKKHADFITSSGM